MDEKEKNFLEMMDSIDKNLKETRKNDLKKLLCASPLLLFFICPFVPLTLRSILISISIVSSSVLTLVFQKKLHRKEKKLKEEFDNHLSDLDNFSWNDKSNSLGKSPYKRKFSNKKTLRFPNELRTCIDIQFFEEYINSVVECLQETNDIELEVTSNEIIDEFLNPLYNVLGDNVKIIPTQESITDIVVKMKGVDVKRKSALYVYDGDCFYIYVPNKDAVVLFPISNEEMFRIFASNPKNYDDRVLFNFFEEVYGYFDYDPKKGKQK